MKNKREKLGEIGPAVKDNINVQSAGQDGRARTSAVSENGVCKVEQDGATAQWEKLFQVLEGVGIRVVGCDVPDKARDVSFKQSEE